MNLEERARQAAQGIYRSVGASAPFGVASPPTIERFRRYREGRLRTQRIGAALLALALAAAALILMVRALGPSQRDRPATPTPAGGLILFGQWHQELEQASWFTMRPDGSGIRDLHIVATCADWFPDGSRILITNDAAVGPGSPLRPAIVNPDGTDRRPLDATQDPDLNLGCGDVSPDESRIVLEGFGRSRLRGVYTVRASDGGGLVRLTHGADAVPRYSPDGGQVVFLRTKAGVNPNGAGALFVVSAEGTGLHRITPWGFAFLYDDWSPDGRWIAFERPYGQLYLVHPDGTGLHRIPIQLPPGTGAANPSWSPDGAWLVFALQRSGQGKIYMVRPDGTGLQRVTGARGAQEQTPDWGRQTG